MEIASTTTFSAIELINLSKDIAQLNLGYLGISVAILGVLGGVFIYFNIKPLKDALDKQEKTINDLREEANKLLEKSKEQSNEALENFKKNQTSALSTLLKEQYDKTILETEKRSADFENAFLEKIDNIVENKDVKLKEVILSDTNNLLGKLEKSLSAALGDSKKELEKQIADINKTINLLKAENKDFKRDLKKLKVYRYSQEGKMGAIIYSIELLKEDINEKSWEIPTSLENLAKQIKDTKLDADYITQIEEQLARIEGEKKYNVLIKEVRKQYNQ